jgi:hypothetical protein
MARDENVPMEPAVVQGGLYFATEYHSFQARSNISEPGLRLCKGETGKVGFGVTS